MVLLVVDELTKEISLAIVDKTAAFVARNGIDFENKIREKEAANPRFSFLSATDPYNAYYQHKVIEFRDGKTTEPSVPVNYHFTLTCYFKKLKARHF